MSAPKVGKGTVQVVKGPVQTVQPAIKGPKKPIQYANEDDKILLPDGTIGTVGQLVLKFEKAPSVKKTESLAAFFREILTNGGALTTSEMKELRKKVGTQVDRRLPSVGRLFKDGYLRRVKPKKGRARYALSEKANTDVLSQAQAPMASASGEAGQAPELEVS